MRKFIHAGEAIFGLFGECLDQQMFDALRELGRKSLRVWQRVVDLLDQHRGRRVGDIRLAPGDHFKQHDTQRINIGARINLLCQTLLGRHVLGRADADARAGDCLAIARVKDFGDAEIAEQRLAPLGDEDVGGFDVAVEHPMPVSIFQRPSHWKEQLNRLTPVHWFAHARFQRAARHVFHHQIRRILELAEIMDFDNVEMAEARQSLGLALETFEQLVQYGGAKQFGAQELNGNLALQAGVIGLEDRRHAALAKRFENVVTTDRISRGYFHRKPPFNFKTSRKAIKY